MKQFFVTRKETCQTCDGKGIVANSEWQPYFVAEKEFRKINQRGMDYDEMCAWWRDVGGSHILPPEEESCSECQGQGWIETTVELMEALKELLGEHVLQDQIFWHRLKTCKFQ